MPKEDGWDDLDEQAVANMLGDGCPNDGPFFWEKGEQKPTCPPTAPVQGADCPPTGKLKDGGRAGLG